MELKHKLEIIESNGKEMAIIIRFDYKEDGVKFVTDEEDEMQLAYMTRKEGQIIKSHVHQKVDRTIKTTQEVLIIKKGKIEVKLYSNDLEYITTTILEKGDIILLKNGGHGFKVIEDTEMIEIKQGPYLKEVDKTYF